MSTSEQMSCQGMCGCLGPGEQYQRERVRWLGNMPTETEMKRDGYFPMGFKSLGKVPSYNQFQWGRSDNTYASRKVVQLPQTPQSRSYFQEAAQPVTLEFCGCKMECTGSSCQGIVQPSSARCASIAKAWQIPNKTKCAGPTGVCHLANEQARGPGGFDATFTNCTGNWKASPAYKPSPPQSRSYFQEAAQRKSSTPNPCPGGIPRPGFVNANDATTWCMKNSSNFKQLGDCIMKIYDPVYCAWNDVNPHRR